MICHVSFGTIRTAPRTWLKTIPYFASILSKISDKREVVSIHFALEADTISFENVTYHFIEDTISERILLSRIARLVRSLNPQAIILHGFHAGFTTYRFATMMADFAVYVQHHGEKVFGFPKRLLQKSIDKIVKGYLFSSKEMGESWVREGLIESWDKILEVPEVTSSFTVNNPQAARERTLSFIWVGRLDANKDPITLVDGFIRFLKVQPNAKLLMIFGTTELLTEIENRTRDFRENIHLVGHCQHSEMPGFYRAADFIISTSLFEAAGVSVLEGISCGCIPILSDIPPFKKITAQGRVGLLFKKASPVALSETLLKAAHLDITEQRKKTLAHFDEHFSSAAIADKIIEITDCLEKAKSSV